MKPHAFPHVLAVAWRFYQQPVPTALVLETLCCLYSVQEDSLRGIGEDHLFQCCL